MAPSFLKRLIWIIICSIPAKIPVQVFSSHFVGQAGLGYVAVEFN